MLKIFKKVRIETIYGKNLQSYLVYGIGEILLVVIGILIALNVNNWNIKRKNLILEQSYIEGLMEDIKHDTLFFNATYFKNIKHKKRALNHVKGYINGENIVTDTLQFIKEIGYGGRYGQLAIVMNNSSYIELLSSGNFRIITNKDLRKKLIDYYILFDHSMNTINNQRTGYADYINSLRPFDRENPDNIDRIDQKYMLENLKNENYYKLINQELTYANNLESFAGNIKDTAIELLDLLKKANVQ